MWGFVRFIFWTGMIIIHFMESGRLFSPATPKYLWLASLMSFLAAIFGNIGLWLMLWVLLFKQFLYFLVWTPLAYIGKYIFKDETWDPSSIPGADFNTIALFIIASVCCYIAYKCLTLYPYFIEKNRELNIHGKKKTRVSIDF